MKISELKSVHDALVETIDSYNDAAQDEDRGRSELSLAIVICDDGSGTIGVRDPVSGDVSDWYTFDDLDGFAKVLAEQWGIDFEEEE